MLEQEGGKLSYDRTNMRLAHESRYIDDQGNGGEYKYIHDFKSVSRPCLDNICLVHLSYDDNYPSVSPVLVFCLSHSLYMSLPIFCLYVCLSH